MKEFLQTVDFLPIKRVYKSDDIAEGVMLSSSKHGGHGLSERTLRRAQGAPALWFVFAFTFFLFLSLNVLAQGTNTNPKDTSKRFFLIDAPLLRKPQQPLAVIDGKIYKRYKRKLKRIDPNSILNIIILKDRVAVSEYGPKGANGVIIITTDRDKNIDTVADVNFLDKNAVYMIDGVVSPNKLNGIDRQNIVSIMILKKLACNSCYINVGDHGAVIVVTKQGAVKAYQKKFSMFSTKYKDYVEHHQDNDDSINYLVDGVFLRMNSAHPIKDLYEIPFHKIKKVDFIENQFYNGGDSRPYMAIITTKK